MDENFRSASVWLIAALEMQGNQSEAFECQMKLLALQKADAETIQLYQTIYQTSGWQGVLRERVKRFDQGNQAFFYGAAYNAPLGTRKKRLNIWRKRINDASCGCFIFKLTRVLIRCATTRVLMNWSGASVFRNESFELTR